ncbi:TolB family protein [Microbispora amethystogenes]|uniref:TolB-like translocation protein signal peptide n=1 Tax=Microbispora amethystogenes TaxID=1427754 RepID=A0ABQ4FJZ7_9ACTN|nr:PD40 domain-containing protein [Microbispora amethystogenes]GIH35142.1 TolB-like translocation protein; signal peptide [Microbispora amethystogenes]
MTVPPRRTVPPRLTVLLAAVLLLGSLSVWAVVHAAARAESRGLPRAAEPAAGPGAVTLAAGHERRMLFRTMEWGPHRDEVVAVPADDPGAARVSAGVRCLRFHASSGTGSCLQAVHGSLGDTYRAVVLDARLRERRAFPLAGIPTRTRVSPSGRMAAWTVFVSGESYAGTNFSTRTSILDTRTWSLQDNLETYSVVKDGRPYHAADVNLWGVTFADDGHFWVTLATGGRTWLARGDVAARTLTTVRENVECPSLSPDGTRLAFKKRVPGLPEDAPWRLYVLDLRTMRETPVAERRSVDDQAVWLDARTLGYALPGDFGADVWTVPADGSGAPRRLLTAALAPVVVE